MPTSSDTTQGRSDTARRAHEYTEQELENLILEARVTEPGWWKSPAGGFKFFLVLLGLVLLAAFVYQRLLLGVEYRLAGLLPNGAQLATALVAVVAAVFAYYQWADARRESSLEKFYERLKLVNERYASKDARELVPHFWGNSADEAEFHRRMYVFVELDNLEYMIVRFQLGFVRKRLFWRAIRTFASRCESDAFRDLARQLVDGSGYDKKTVDITNVLGRLADLRAGGSGMRTLPRSA